MEEIYIVNKKGNEVIINFPTKYIDTGHKSIIRLKENYTEYGYLFKKMINIEKEKYTFNGGNFGYYECEIFDCENEIVFEESETFLGILNLKIDFKTPQAFIRTGIQVNDDGFIENTKVFIDKKKKIYFSKSELKSKISDIFEDIIQNAQEFVYIQDPYFDYTFYVTLIEKLPSNLDVKVMYAKDRIYEKLKLPSNHKLTLIRDNNQDGKIHDRFIITKDFGYFIGISLNGQDDNKSSINYIYDTTELTKYFE